MAVERFQLSTEKIYVPFVGPKDVISYWDTHIQNRQWTVHVPTGQREYRDIGLTAEEWASKERVQEMGLYAESLVVQSWKKEPKHKATRHDRDELAGSLKEVVASNRRRHTQMADKYYGLGGYFSDR